MEIDADRFERFAELGLVDIAGWLEIWVEYLADGAVAVDEMRHPQFDERIVVWMPGGVRRVPAQQPVKRLDARYRASGERRQLPVCVHHRYVHHRLPWIARIALAIERPFGAIGMS
jgi:hypothetical protein